jgi:hypothetical protein
MKRRISTLAAALALLMTSCDGEPESPKSPKAAAPKPRATVPSSVAPTTEWTPDASLVGQLAGETEVIGNPDFLIRPPAGYEAQPLETTPAATISRWVSPTRPDGSVHQLLVIVGKQPQTGPASQDFQQYAAGFLSTREAEVGVVRMQPAEFGKINGLKFVCVPWFAKNTANSLRTHGFVYVASPGSSDVILYSQDIEPHNASTLKLANAAARTFRVRESRR